MKPENPHPQTSGTLKEKGQDAKVNLAGVSQSGEMVNPNQKKERAKTKK